MGLPQWHPLWHYDPTKWLIRSCEWVGLTSDLKRVSPLSIETARLEMQYRKATERCDRLINADTLRARLEEEIALRDSYREVRYQLKLRRQRWRELMQSFADVPQVAV